MILSCQSSGMEGGGKRRTVRAHQCLAVQPCVLFAQFFGNVDASGPWAQHKRPYTYLFDLIRPPAACTQENNPNPQWNYACMPYNEASHVTSLLRSNSVYEHFSLNLSSDSACRPSARVCNPGLPEPENPGNPDFFQTRNPGLNCLPNPGFRVWIFPFFTCVISSM